MNYLLCLFLLIAGCTDEAFIQNPKCVDGYLVYNVNGTFQGFCLNVYGKAAGLKASGCFDGPAQGSRVQMDLVMLEGYYAKTKCYNILSQEKSGQ